MISQRIWDRFRRALVGGLALVTAGSFFNESAWWLDLLADFKTQFVVVAALLLAAAAARRRWKEAALALALLAVNGIPLAPYLAPAPANQTAMKAEGAAGIGQGTMKVIGFNLDVHNTDTVPTLDFLRLENADVVVLTEITEAWRKALEPLFDAYPHRFFGPLYYPPGYPPHTMGLFSKRPWVETGVEWSDATGRAYAVWARFPAASPSLTVAAVHLNNPLLMPLSYQQAEARALAAAVKRFDGPVVLAGDFNMTPFSHRWGTLLRKSNLRRPGGGLNATWPALLTPLGLSLDHILVGNGIRRASMRTGPRLGSDHLPVVGTFDLGE